ncbi:MAG: ATP-binding cassette domain-containing protein [Sulfuriflexus sp.]|nr:ATP-binding cassette domain-containing protein [Sulfuriflexus sp.]
MLRLEQLSLRRGVRELLHDVTCTIHAGQKVGITGANGTGKSSLFALIRGELHADGGDISIIPGTVIAHVAQETPATGMAAIEYVLDGDLELRKLEKKLQQAEENHDGGQLAELYAALDTIHGHTARSRAGRLLHGLGFTAKQEELPVDNFSGGWRMRLNLAQALMCRSDLLLLDEPTNHLDLDAVIWLEGWLRNYEGTLLLISHDRDFLDTVATHIGHIDQTTLTVYTGNYSAFEVRRAEQLSHQQAAYVRQQREIAHMQKFVDRFRAKATKARQAQSRVKALERMTIINQAHVDSPFNFHFRPADEVPNPLLKMEQVTIGYDNTPILEKVKLIIGEGDRIGLLGHNGAGKSTLIKFIAGELQALSGKSQFASATKIGYFAQHQLEQLDPQASPLLHLQRLDKKASEQDLRNYLGGFAFNGDMATAAVAPFSGGEKARLVLALLVYQKPNLLLLDEPTNHLDLEMRHALSVALQEFEGALVVVSHDRHLLKTVTDTLLLVADGKVETFDGDLDDYRQWLKEQNRQQASNSDISTKEPTQDNRKQQRQTAAEQRKLTQPLRNKIKKCEKLMGSLSKDKEKLEQQLADNDLYSKANKQKLKDLLEQQASICKNLAEAEEEWMMASEELEIIQE